MSDGTEHEPTEFQLDQEITLTFNAKDIVEKLSPLDVVELIKELDLELNEWAGTILLASYFSAQLPNAPADEVAMSNEELEASLDELTHDEAVDG